MSVTRQDVDHICVALPGAGAAINAPYFHKSWVGSPFGATDIREVTHRAGVSCDIIRKSLPKATRTALPARTEG